MMKRKDWTKVLFLYMCLCHVIPAHPCGENPLRRFQPLTRVLNELFPDEDINTVLNFLRESNSAVYRRLQSEWRLYADCVGLVDTGYFKRSGGMMPVYTGKMAEARKEQARQWKRDMSSRSGTNKWNHLIGILNGKDDDKMQLLEDQSF